IALNNSATGIFDVESGRLNASSTGAWTGGTLNTGASGVLEMSGSYLISGAFIGAGAGHLELTGTLSSTSAGATLNFPSGYFQWLSGTLVGTGTGITNLGFISITGAADVRLQTTLINSGTIVQSGDRSLLFGGSTKLINNAGAVYDLAGNGDFGQSGIGGGFGPFFQNDGTFRKSAGTDVSILDGDQLTNSATGVIEVLSGRLKLATDSTWTGATFHISDGAAFEIAANLRTSGTFTGTGAGQLLLTSDISAVDSSTTFNFPDGFFQWTSGTISASSGLTNAGSLTLSGDSGESFYRSNVLNTGKIIVSGIGPFSIDGTLTNDVTGVIELQGAAQVSLGGIVVNSGKLLKTGTGTALFSAQLNNGALGAIEARSGTLNLAGGGVWDRADLNAAGGATINLVAGHYSTTGEITGTGSGRVELSGAAELTGDGQLATLNFPAGAFFWTGGTLLSRNGTFTNEGAITIDGSANKLFYRSPIANAGQIIVKGTGDLDFGDTFVGSTLTNLPGAVIDFQSDVHFFDGGQVIPGSIVNSGTILKSAGPGIAAIDVAVNNTGVIDVQSGTISLQRAVTQLSGTTLAGGSWEVGANSTLAITTGSNITTNLANIALTGSNATFAKIAPLATNNGSFTLDGGAGFTATGNFINFGAITLGPASTLAVVGSFSQGGGKSSLRQEIGGRPASGLFGKLTVTGQAGLGGQLIFSLANGFGPVLGDQYQVQQYGSAVGSYDLISGLSPYFSVDVQAAQTLLTSTASSASLAVQSVTPPVSGLVGQNLSIPFTVRNEDSVAIAGNWFDAVYLSRDEVLSADDIFFARVPHTTGLSASGSYDAVASANLPNVPAGDYHVIVIADTTHNVADTNRENNILASATTVSITAPALAFDTPTTATITNNQTLLYRVDATAGADIVLDASFAVSLEADVLVGFGRVPTSGNFDYSASDLTQLNRQIVISNPQAGPYYIVILGREGAPTPQSFTLNARFAGFEVRNIGPNHGSNIGQATITVKGSGFTPDSVVQLIAPNTLTRTALSVSYRDSNTLFATFDLTGLPASVGYDVRVANGPQATTASDLFTVNSGVRRDVNVVLSTPQLIRGGTSGEITIEISNSGETDIPAPLLLLSSDNARFRLPGATSFTDDSILLLGINSSGPAGVLPPGSRQSLTVEFQPKTTGAHVASNFQIAVADPGLAINWAGLKTQLRPPTVPTDAWDAIYPNFLAEVGTTQGDLQKILDTAATYLSSLGETTPDFNQLLSVVVQEAGAFGTIADHYRLGAFGRGQFDPTNIFALADAQGNVGIYVSGHVRTFVRQSDGSFQGAPGDFAQLSIVNGTYRLRETDGMLFVFLGNGDLDYTQELNGRRIQNAYSNGQLVSRTNSIGDVTSFSYNPQGRISQITDPVGRITTFTYDASGEHLLSISDSFGTVSYTYVTGQGATRENAVQSIAYPDGTHLFFTYDASGKLLSRSRDGGADALTFSYDNLGQITVTDAEGQHAVISDDAFDQVARVQSPLEGVTALAYDANRQITTINYSGLVTTIDRDAKGNPIRTVDPLGQVVNSQFDPNSNNTQNVTDANGNPRSFAYDSHGNLITTTTADQSQNHYSYDALGNLTVSVNRDGKTTLYTYNSKNLLIHTAYEDGTFLDYSYDAHRRLISVTDPQGVTHLTYDATGHLTSLAYPDGRALTYKYDAGGRLIQTSTQDGFVTNYQYNAVGRLESTTNGNGNLIVSYLYDSLGRLSKRTLGNGDFTTYSYNERSEIENLVNHAPDGSVSSHFDYAYDHLGRTISMTTAEGETDYGYDATGQLISVKLPNGRTIVYQYDAAGNRISVTDNGTVTDYASNSVNEYTSVGTTNYTYDADGRLLTKTDESGTTNYSYDDRNHLTSVVSPTDTWVNEYNAFGNLVAVVHNGQRTEYLVDPQGLSSVVGEYQANGTLVAHYSQGGELASRVDATGASNYYEYDANGDTVDLSNAAGGDVNTYSYLPFGEQLSATGTASNPFTYVGQLGVMNQGAGGLYYMRNRWYDPATGRFTSPDPLGLGGQDTNLYRYTGNEVVNISDPSGLADGGIKPVSGSVKPVTESPKLGGPPPDPEVYQPLPEKEVTPEQTPVTE
ncbi:MAG: repeat-associated core domain protein, partial [Planctomycetaceae bacterium]|nr:repeat-associated core domain protein [Planctomycetaceae bacterium]